MLTDLSDFLFNNEASNFIKVNEDEVLENDQYQLAVAEKNIKIFLEKILKKGVKIISPDTVFFFWY